VAQLKYLGMTVTDQNLIQEEVERRLNLSNACYHSVLDLLHSCILSKNINIKLYRTVILPVVLFECESLALTLSQELTWRVFGTGCFGGYLDEGEIK
jgi:hypothetical protein